MSFLNFLGYYLAIDAVASLIALVLIIKRRDYIRVALRSFLSVPAACPGHFCHCESEETTEEDEGLSYDDVTGDDEEDL